MTQQDKLHFFYDAQSRPVKISYNGVIYTYVHNLQGDIVGILDSTGALVVEYKYDAWGKLLSTTGSLADTLGRRNPFRYRGYVYDEESELYYLRSRMYAPSLNRFVNSDKYVIATSYPLRCNTYAYCCNEPVVHVDRNGNFFQKIASWFKDTIIGGLIEKYAPNQLNVVEKTLAKNHPIAAAKANWARNTANTVTAGLFGSNWNSDNTRENAFKHCLWNALMAYSMGEDLARQFGEAHEYGMMENYPESTKMDLHNNEVGYSLVVAPPTPDELSKAALARYAACYEPIYPTGDWKIYIIIDRVYNALQDGTLYYFE